MFIRNFVRTIVLTALSFLALALTAQSQQLFVLNSFDGRNGSQPYGQLVADSHGNLYGVTILGGTSGAGVAYKLTHTSEGWVETVLHEFSGGSDGGGPSAPLAVDSAGNVYGAASFGGPINEGLIFKLSPSGSGWTETVLHNFNVGDAAVPGGLVFDKAGNLYGTASIASGGYGGVFELTPTGSGGWNYSLIHVFKAHHRDGAIPYGTVAIDTHGVIYGVTSQGGTTDWGTVFSMTQNGGVWTESVIYNFQGFPDGQVPFGGVTLASNGTLYGTTLLGGTIGYGSLFGMTHNAGKWNEKIVYSFASAGDAQSPAGPLAMDRFGNLFGATQFGGAYLLGTVYEVSPGSQGWQEKIIYNFDVPTNLNGVNAVLVDKADNLYGVGPGNGNQGIVFEIVP